MEATLKLPSWLAVFRGPAPAGSAVPVILGVDVEPDARVVDLRNPSWDATAAFFSKVADLRRRAAAVAGAPLRFTWFPRADPQVEIANGSAGWALENFRADWNAVRLEGDEIGLHMHPWRWDEAAGGWCQDHADEDWVVGCARSAIETFRTAFGHTPACYRGGDRYLSNAVVRLLEDEGVALDLTLERMPGVPRLVMAERGTGEIPDGTAVPLRAYRPSSADFRVPDPDRTSGLAMLPLTAYGQASLVPWLPNKEFEQALDALISRHADGSQKLTHMAFVARSDLANIPQWDAFARNILTLARRVRAGQLAFATASGAWQRIRRAEPERRPPD